jgi:hypothetical protein
LAVLLLLMSAAPAFAECAWVLWAHGEIIGEYPTAATVGEPWRTVEGWSTRSECETNKALSTRRLREEESREASTAKREWKLIMGEYADKAKIVVEYLCLPDTIDPRGPKGGGR